MSGILSSAGIAILAATQQISGQDTPTLSAAQSDFGVELSWSGSVLQADGAVLRPHAELQQSGDLRTWTPIGQRMRAAASGGDTRQRVTVERNAEEKFFRLLTVVPAGELKLASTGEEVFGYADAFQRELRQIGQISPEDFAARFNSTAQYLPGISWDPTTGQYWDLFATDPRAYNRGLDPAVDDVRLTDFRLNAAELSVFAKNGFVVSERLGSHSFADIFYKLWKDDLPVFVSTDAILEAWHRTYDMMMEELEETVFYASVDKMLGGMAAQIPTAWEQTKDGFVAESVRDADYFIAVARSFLAGTNGPVASLLDQDGRVAATLQAVAGEKLDEFNLFGACRTVDYSQFKVRGRYENSERLGRYFQCMTWLGRIDFRVAGGPFQDCHGEPMEMASPREMAGAIVLWHLLDQSGEFTTWLNMDRALQAFVGYADSMTFAQLGQLLATAGIPALADLSDAAAVERIQRLIVEGDLGAQNIRSDYFYSPLGPAQVVLPRSFGAFGQRFTPDSWALKKVVFDDVLWTEEGQTFEVCRRVPSALDVAFSVLGNDQIIPEIVARITDPSAATSADSVVRLRDGLPYQHNLAAVRNVIDAQGPGARRESIYLGWLDTLRALSTPTTDPSYPEAMRTHAWAMKTLNTQLASWRHLRHDTVLYAKQPYTSGGDCSFPSGYVEPRVEFWGRLRLMALRAAEWISGLEYTGEFRYPITEFFPEVGRINLGEAVASLPEIKERQLDHLRRFADTVGILDQISRKELAQQCLDEAETNFLRDLIEEDGWLPWGGSSRLRTYSGWYSQLFYINFGR